MLEIVVERIPATENDVISILQQYKRCAQIVFRGKVNLFFDRLGDEDDRIKFEIPVTGNFYSKKVVYYQLSYHKLGMEELIPNVALLKLVDGWLANMGIGEAEALFWRYINHDFEKAEDGKGYNTLSFVEIEKRMNMDSVTIWRLCRRGLRKIMKTVRNSSEEYSI